MSLRMCPSAAVADAHEYYTGDAMNKKKHIKHQLTICLASNNIMLCFSVWFAPFGRCMVLNFLNHAVSQPASSNSNVMTLQEVTLERITKNNTKFVRVLLRPVYETPAKVKAGKWIQD